MSAIILMGVLPILIGIVFLLMVMLLIFVLDDIALKGHFTKKLHSLLGINNEKSI